MVDKGLIHSSIELRDGDLSEYFKTIADGSIDLIHVSGKAVQSETIGSCIAKLSNHGLLMTHNADKVEVENPATWYTFTLQHSGGLTMYSRNKEALLVIVRLWSQCLEDRGEYIYHRAYPYIKIN